MRGMASRIGPRKPPRIFIAEWREAKGLTQEQLAQRLDTTDVTVSRWETGKRFPDDRAKAAIAHAMNIEVIDLFRLPTQPSADALLRGQPKEVVEQAMRLIQAIRR